MYILLTFMFIADNLHFIQGASPVATARRRSHKHFQLDTIKIKRAQKLLQARTQTETIERALDLAIAEHERNRLTLEATERFVRSGAEIQDVYGALES
jgi:hypothetical protein